jgi:hypothetical protein
MPVGYQRALVPDSGGAVLPFDRDLHLGHDDVAAGRPVGEQMLGMLEAEEAASNARLAKKGLPD